MWGGNGWCAQARRSNAHAAVADRCLSRLRGEHRTTRPPPQQRRQRQQRQTAAAAPGTSRKTHSAVRLFASLRAIGVALRSASQHRPRGCDHLEFSLGAPPTSFRTLPGLPAGLIGGWPLQLFSIHGRKVFIARRLVALLLLCVLLQDLTVFLLFSGAAGDGLGARFDGRFLFQRTADRQLTLRA